MGGPIRNLVFLLLGHFQKPSDRSGLNKLFDRLYAIRHVRVEMPKRWNASAKHVAGFADDHLADRSVLVLVGYSLGGYLALLICWILHKRTGRRVDLVILLDGVWRLRLAKYSLVLRSASVFSSWLPTRWRPALAFPSNVDRVISYYQTEDYPRGHRVKRHRSQKRLPEEKRTKIERRLVTRGHAAVDDLGWIHEEIETEIETVAIPGEPHGNG